MARLRRWPAAREPKGIAIRFAKALRSLLEAQAALVRRELLDSGRWEGATAKIRERIGIRGDEPSWRDAAAELEARAPELFGPVVAETVFDRRADDEIDDLGDAMDGIRIQVEREQPDEVIADMVERYGLETTEHNLADFRRQYKAARGFDVVGQAPHERDIIRSYVRDNVRLIKTVRGERLDRVRAIVERNWRIGSRWETVSAQLRKELGLTPGIANRIARDQVQKLNGELARDRLIAAGVDRFIWRTSKDGRVRRTHRVLEGKEFDIETGHPTEGFPGWPIHCRCYAEPVFPDDDEIGPAPTGGEPDRRPFPRRIGTARTVGPARPNRTPAPRSRVAPPVAAPAVQAPRGATEVFAARVVADAARRAHGAATALEAGEIGPTAAAAVLAEVRTVLSQAGDLPIGEISDLRSAIRALARALARVGR